MASDQSTPDQSSGRPDLRGVIIIVVCALVVLASVVAAVLASRDGDLFGGPAPPSSTSPGASDAPDASDDPSAPDDPAGPGTILPPQDPVPLDDAAEVEPGLQASLSLIEEVAGEARLPGEVAGPAIRVTVQLSNTTEAAISLRATVVTAYHGPDQTPGLMLTSPGAVELPPEVGAGQTVSGVYVFTIPPEQRDTVRIMVDHSVDVAPIVFEGPVAS